MNLTVFFESVALLARSKQSREDLDMFKHKSSDVSRRTFIKDAGLAAGGMLLAPYAAGAMEPRATAVLEKEAPRRILGKTKESVTTLAMGTCAAGLSRDVTVEDIATMVQVALDSGVRYFVRLASMESGGGVGRGLGSRHKEVFLPARSPPRRGCGTIVGIAQAVED